MRKLATVGLSYSAAVFLAHYLLPQAWLPYFAAGVAALAAGGFFLKGDARLRVVLIALPSAVGLIWSFAFTNLFIVSADELSEEDVSITATVLDYSTDYENVSYVYVRVSLDGMPTTKARLASYNGDFSELRPGDIIEATVRMSSSAKRYDMETDMYTSSGTFLTGSIRGAVEVTGRSSFAFMYFPKEITKALRDTIDECMPGDVSGFLKALLTGDKSDIYADAELGSAMSAAGLMHVVAISGMHVAFLISFVRLITGRRRAAAAIAIPLILIFIPMTGGSASVIRAGFMQICLLMAPLLRRESDGVTSLFAVLMLLLLQNPAAAGSVGLQLSFAAMAGIVLITPRVHDWSMHFADGRKLADGKFASRAVRFVSSSLSSTIGALVFTTPLVALHFGYISLYSVLTNLLTLWAVSLCFTLGYAVCILGLIWQVLGASAGWVLAWPLRYVILVVKLIAKLPYAAIYTTNNLASWWLVFTYVVFSLGYIFKGKAPFRPAMPLGLSVCALCTVLFLSSWTYSQGLTLTAVDVGQGASLAVFSGNDTVLIDCGGKGEPERAGVSVANYLLGKGRSSVDLLVLTHLHSDHTNGVAELMSRMEVKRIAMPYGVEDDDGMLPEILEAALKYDAELLFIEEDSLVRLGVLELQLFAPIGAVGANERGLIILGAANGFDFLVTGDAGSEIERRLLFRNDIPELELLVAGHHGSGYSSCKELLAIASPEVALISVGHNSYGHPAPDTLQRLHAAGVETYRTDLAGNITIRVN